MKSDTSFLMPSTYVSFFIGLISGVTFYGTLYLVTMKYPDSPIHRMVGPVSGEIGSNPFTPFIYGSLYILFFWGMAMIFSKWRLLRYETSGLTVLNKNLDSGRIISKRSEIDAFRNNIVNGPGCNKIRKTALVHTLLFLIDHCLVTEASNRALQLFNKRLETLERHIDSSYNLLRYIAWAIPSLGFIGTVLGIGSALSSVERAMQDMKLVTQPLGVAFDTTLIALMISLVLMFFLYGMQRKEESLLNSIDLFCQEKFIINLQLGS